jgi:hypothetical protein
MATFLLTPAGVKPSSLAAAEKLPVSALLTKDSILAKLSISSAFNFWLKKFSLITRYL